MKKLKRTLITVTLAAALVLGISVPVSAASGSWRINYIPTSPSTVGNQTDSVSLPYWSDGYYAYCNYFAGANGSRIVIRSDHSMPTIVMTSTGRSASWEMDYATSTRVKFILTAVSGFPCNATGSINTN